MASLSKILLGGRLEPGVVADAERASFVKVDDPWHQYTAFFLRLVAATVVATAGIAADSATAVIGAMLLAPLMSPMLGAALATALGRPAKTLQTLALTLVGMAAVIAVSACVTAIVPVAIGLSTNAQVLARISPRLVDLITALAAGFMAALASIRRDIPGTAPGIALSASIVPPLCVTGAALFEGAPDAALGSFLLFVTNYVAIQIAGTAVYLAAGLGARKFSVIEGKARELWYISVGIAAAVVVALLATTSMDIVHENERLRIAQDEVGAWIEGSDYRVSRFELEDGELRLEIAGSEHVPSAERLNRALLDAGLHLDELSIAVVDEQRIVNTS